MWRSALLGLTISLSLSHAALSQAYTLLSRRIICMNRFLNLAENDSCFLIPHRTANRRTANRLPTNPTELPNPSKARGKISAWAGLSRNPFVKN